MLATVAWELRELEPTVVAGDEGAAGEGWLGNVKESMALDSDWAGAAWVAGRVKPFAPELLGVEADGADVAGTEDAKLDRLPEPIVWLDGVDAGVGGAGIAKVLDATLSGRLYALGAGDLVAEPAGDEVVGADDLLPKV